MSLYTMLDVSIKYGKRDTYLDLTITRHSARQRCLAILCLDYHLTSTEIGKSRHTWTSVEFNTMGSFIRCLRENLEVARSSYMINKLGIPVTWIVTVIHVHCEFTRPFFLRISCDVDMEWTRFHIPA
jgi:hypothetical protein